MKGFSYSIKERMTPRNDFVSRFCGEVKEKNILDIGCGFGWYEKMAIENGAKSITGIEPDKKNFQQTANEIPKAKFVVAAAENLPFCNCSFDKVVMLEVLEHLPKGTEYKSIKEVYRVLASNGEFILSTPNKHFLSCLLDPAWYFGHRHYSLNQVKKIVEKNGFLINKVFVYGGFWELFRMIPHYFFKWVFKKEDPFKKIFEKKMKKDKNNPNNYAYIYIKAVKK